MPLLIGGGVAAIALLSSKEKKEKRKNLQNRFDRLKKNVRDTVEASDGELPDGDTAAILRDDDGEFLGVTLAEENGTLISATTGGTLLEEPGFEMFDEDGNSLGCSDAQGNELSCKELDRRINEASNTYPNLVW